MVLLYSTQIWFPVKRTLNIRAFFLSAKHYKTCVYDKEFKDFYVDVLTPYTTSKTFLYTKALLWVKVRPQATEKRLSHQLLE